MLVALLPDDRRYDERARAACVWIGDVGDALIALARGSSAAPASTVEAPPNMPAWAKAG
jgi:hypothetical protein